MRPSFRKFQESTLLSGEGFHLIGSRNSDKAAIFNCFSGVFAVGAWRAVTEWDNNKQMKLGAFVFSFSVLLI